MANFEEAEVDVYGSRTVFVMLLLYRVMGVTNSLFLPSVALKCGALGTLFIIISAYVVLGIPLVYMELIVSQFTGRDVIDMWKIRPCISHIGYFMVLWQMLVLLYNHVMGSLLLHYFLISLEIEPPYTVCGKWTTPDCDILKNNHTLNQFCIKIKEPSSYCENLYLYFPEQQYFSRGIFGLKTEGFQITWAICLASAVIITFMFFNCFRGIKSMRWFVYPMTLIPVLGTVLLLTGSMRQKGLIAHYADSLDTELAVFATNYKVSAVVMQTVYSLGAGSGVVSNLAAAAAFRSPCYGNAVIAVLCAAGFTSLSVAVAAMMPCAYASEYGDPPWAFLRTPISYTFVKLPKMLAEYTNKAVWILIVYMSQSVLLICSDVIIFYTLLEMCARRSAKIEKYYALVTIFGLLILFLGTIPGISSLGKDLVSSSFRSCVAIGAVFFSLCESIVFISWYGFDRFYEDIHFMQGIQPKNIIKVSWMVLNVVLAYVFIVEYVTLIKGTKTRVEEIGMYTMTAIIAAVFLVFLLKIVVAAVHKKFVHQFKVDPKWGPPSEVLRRSRAMFTAHAMTKEYMYRQYHLQAGVVARQVRSNVRNTVVRNNNFGAYQNTSV